MKEEARKSYYQYFERDIELTIIFRGSEMSHEADLLSSDGFGPAAPGACAHGGPSVL
jgi:hypothetical protein